MPAGVIHRVPLHERLTLRSRNTLKLGIFGPNCSAGLAKTKVPERWSGSWPDNVALARMLDAAGIEFILPVGRWRGYGGETNPQAETFETLTWAAGLLGATESITVFATVHAPLIHPVFAAKMCVTADHIGRGRLGLNVVCGSHKSEFDMFDEPVRESQEAYDLGGEWLEIVMRLWAEETPFDYDGRFFRLHDVEGLPKPYGGARPVILNAGISAAGKAFGTRYADDLFTGFETIEDAIADVREIRAGAEALGRTIGVYSAVNVVCRPTQRSADDYYHYFADEMADWDALQSRTSRYEDRVRLIAGYGGYPCVGTPDAVARELASLSAAGFDGLALGFVNYLDEFPYFRDEVLPRLAAVGVRAA